MRKYSLILVFILALAIIPARAFCYQGEVEDISGGKYFPAVKKAISEASESIYMVMFKVGLRPYDESSSVYKLVEELVNAHKRGVEVAVILDQNIPFIGKEHIDDWEIEGKNAWCYKRLKESGIDVGYDDAVNYTHAKTLVIDKEIIILGSSNWTESALHRNFETNVLIKSKDLAKELLEKFGNIEKRDADIKYPTPSSPLSWKFMENQKLAGRMMTKHDERAFDLYLLLLRDFDGNEAPRAKARGFLERNTERPLPIRVLKDAVLRPRMYKEGVITLDYDKMAKSLGLYQDLDRTGYRRQIIRSLRTLESKYNLIEFKPQYAENAIIRLKDYDNPYKAYSYPDEWYFELPANYWEYGWDRKLSMRAKFCYLINLAYAGISDAKPWWFASRDVLSKRFNVGIWMISKGMQELRRWNLIDVAYDELGQKPASDRLAKSYKVLPLYDPEELEKEWDSLILKYDGEKVREARSLAGIVFEENAPEIVEDIIKETDKAGVEKIKKAFDILAKKNIDNPKRCYQYVKGVFGKF